jgi:hypothetical protein
MLFRGTITVSFENRKKDINKLCGQNAEIVTALQWYVQFAPAFKGLRG